MNVRTIVLRTTLIPSLVVTRRVYFSVSGSAVNFPSFFATSNMIPPCDPSILEHNPQFKRLYENLTTSLLNPDASTRAHSASPARTVVVEVSWRDAVAQHVLTRPKHNQSSDNTLSLGAEAMPDPKYKKENQGANAPAIGLCPRQQPTRRGQDYPRHSTAHQEKNNITNEPTTPSAMITSL